MLHLIEVEFVAKPGRVLGNGGADELLEEFVFAIAVRVARDFFAQSAMLGQFQKRKYWFDC